MLFPVRLPARGATAGDPRGLRLVRPRACPVAGRHVPKMGMPLLPFVPQIVLHVLRRSRVGER